MISWQPQEEEDAAKSAGPSGAKALTDQAPWQDQNPEPGCQVLGRDDSGHNFPEKLTILMVNQL